MTHATQHTAMTDAHNSEIDYTDGTGNVIPASDLELTNSLETTETERLTEPGDHEISFTIDFALDTEQTVVCRHCGEVNPVPSAPFISAFGIDPSCHECGFPLGMVRDGGEP